MLTSKYFLRLKDENFSIRFILSRILWKTKTCKLLTIKRNGYKLIFFPTALSASLWYQKLERDEDLDVLSKILREGDTYIDIGANIGDLSLHAKNIVGEKGYVLAIEPHPKTYVFLKENIKINKVNIDTLQVAIGNTEGTVHFSNSHSDDQNHIDETGDLSVKITTLDKILCDIKNIKLIKIDIEGYEYFALLGAKNIIERVENIYFEAWDKHLKRSGVNKEDLYNFLIEKGFKLYSERKEPIIDINLMNIENCTNIIAIRQTKDKSHT